MMKIQCTFCGFSKETTADLTGKTVRCPKCSREFVVNTNETDDFVVVEPFQQPHFQQPSPQEVEVEEVKLGEIGYLTITNRRLFGRVFSTGQGFQYVDATLENVTAFGVKRFGSPIFSRLCFILTFNALVVLIGSCEGGNEEIAIFSSVPFCVLVILAIAFLPRLWLEIIIGGLPYRINYGFGDLSKAEAAHQLLLKAKYGKSVTNDAPIGDDEMRKKRSTYAEVAKIYPDDPCPEKIYPDDPCLCGSGKKYRYCCGK